ncbi:MAG TPA: sigma-70 family RNA polymerase sigma factor [Chitinophaga sp.]|uniref:RNA polymerase sigma factor n=1 Tax=Chitinophaga sp. TaxID=1869181 RepID=UPI002BF6915B|nr:sigma-70 family RNA polymerase sigma factor [Chitinophaga sp.]HVI44860.1 sigma-70 family RNA polymerase sigma factor [Chitinophaga sp.]
MIIETDVPTPAPLGFDIDAFRQGDKNAFNTLFRTYYGPLCYFSQKLSVDRSHAEEIAEDALFKIWSKRKGFTHIRAIKAFLYISVKNGSLNVIKAQEREAGKLSQYGDFLTGASAHLAQSTIVELETLIELDRAISQLPPRCKQVITMTYHRGLRSKEIAEQLGISVNTVDFQRHRGIALLRKMLTSKAFLLIQLLLK